MRFVSQSTLLWSYGSRHSRELLLILDFFFQPHVHMSVGVGKKEKLSDRLKFFPFSSTVSLLARRFFYPLSDYPTPGNFLPTPSLLGSTRPMSAAELFSMLPGIAIFPQWVPESQNLLSGDTDLPDHCRHTWHLPGACDWINDWWLTVSFKELFWPAYAHSTQCQIVLNSQL